MGTAKTSALTVRDRYDAESIRLFRANGWWAGGSAAALLDRWADATPNRRFVSDGTTELDYATVRQRAHGGRLDAQGFLRVSGRLKDVIIRGGTNISAAEVEGYVAAHPDVAQAAVVAYPDERLGEKACAVVVPKPGAMPTLQDITAFLKDRRISMQKLPERLLLVDELPMTATGKVQKFLLRERVRQARQD